MQRKSKVRLAISAAVMAALGSQQKASAASYYWIGDHDLNWNTTAGLGGTNWTLDPVTNNDPGGLPGIADDVIFFQPGAANGAPLNTTLGQDFSIRSLTFQASNDQPTAISGNTLTVGTGGITMIGGTVANVINSSVVLGANQTWTNNSTNFSTLTFNGVVSGTGTLTTAGVGPINFTNANTHSGGMVISTSGNVVTYSGAGSALNISSLSVLGGGSLVLDNVSNGANGNRIANNLAVNSSGGTITLNGGSETVGTLQITSGATQINANNTSVLTFGSASIASLTRASGGIVNFSPDGSSSINLPNVAVSNGIIGGWATIGNIGANASDPGNALDFATVSGGKVTALTSYQSDFSSATNNTKLSGTANLANPSTTVNSLYLTGNALLSFGTSTTGNVGSTNVLIIGSGGIISNAATGTQGISNQPLLTNIALIGSTAVVNSNVAGLNKSGFITSSGPDLIVTTASNLQINSVITNNGTNVVGLTKNGSGTLDLSDGNNQGQPGNGAPSITEIANTYTGTTTVNGGTLLINDDQNLGAVPTSFNAASIVLNGGILSTTRGFAFAGNRGITVGPQGGTLQYIGGSNWSITQKITGPGGMTFASMPGGLTGNNVNTVTLSSGTQASNYQGPTILLAQKGANAASAVIIWNQDEQIPDGSAVTIVGDPGTGGINLNGHKETIGSLASSSFAAIIRNVNNTLTVGGNNLSTEYDGIISGTSTTAQFIKNGSGTLIMANSNITFAGNTLINGGKLLLTGQLSGKSLTVANGATIGGNGSAYAPTTVLAGGGIAPALNINFPCTLNFFNSLTMNSGANLNFVMGGVGFSDNIFVNPATNNATSTVTLLGNEVLNIADIPGFGLGTYQLIVAQGGTIMQDSATFSVHGTANFNYQVVATNGINGELDLIVTQGNPIEGWTGAVNGTWDTSTKNWGPGSLAWTNNANANFDDSGLHTAITVAGTGVTAVSMSFSNSTSVPYSFSGAPIIDSGPLTKTQSGPLTFNNAVTVGAANISGGTTTIGVGGSLTSSALAIANSAALVVNGSLDASTNLQNDGVTTFNNATQTLAALNGTGVVNLSVATTLTTQAGVFPGSIAGGGNLVENSPLGQQFTLAGFNYTGTTKVISGILAASGNIGAAGTPIQVGDSSGAANAAFVTAGNVTISRDVTVTAGNTGVNTVGGNTADTSTYAGNVILNNTASPTELTSAGIVNYGSVTGPGAIRVTGGGQTVFNGTAAAYVGNTTIDGGHLVLNGAFTRPTTTLGFTAVGGILDINNTFTIANPIIVGNLQTVNVGTAGILNSSTVVTVTNGGTLNMGGTFAAPGPLTVDGGASNATTNAVANILPGASLSVPVTVNGAAFLQIQGTNAAQSNLVTGPITLSHGGGLFLFDQELATGTSQINVFNGQVNIIGSSGAGDADAILQVRDNGANTIPGAGIFTNVQMANNSSLDIGVAPSAPTPRANIIVDLNLLGTQAFVSSNSDGSSPSFIRNVTSTNAAAVLGLYAIVNTNNANINGGFTSVGAKSMNFAGSLAPNITVTNNEAPPSGVNLTSQTNIGSAFTLNGGTFETDTGGTTNLQTGAAPGTSGTFLVQGGTFNANRSGDATITYNAGTLNLNASQNLVALNLNSSYATPIPVIPATGTNTYTITPITLTVANLAVNSTSTFTVNAYTGGTSTAGSTPANATVFPVSTVNAANTANNGIINGFGPLVGSFGNVSGTGTLNAGDATNVASIGVKRVVQSTLNVANAATVSTVASTTGVGTSSGSVSSIGTLNVNTGGVYDLSNTAVSVGAATPIATIRQYLTNGYSNGNWNGTSGGGITSTWAANDATHRTAVGYAAQPDGTTLVAATLYGDTTLKGSVGLSDYNTLAANFNKPGVWAQGDFDYDGTVTLADYNKLATNFNKSAQPGGGVAASGAAAPASVKLSGSASPAASVLPDGVVDPGAGNVVLEANPSTGQLYLVGHDSNINSYEVDSAAGKLTFVSQKNHGGYNTLTAQSGSTGLPGSALGQNEDIWATISSAAGTFVAEAYPAGSNPAFDTFGPGLQVFDLNVSGLSAWTAGTPISDLTFKYGNGTGNTLTPAVIPIGVPEPTCLALAGIAAGGLLSRRRRKVS